MSQQIWSIENQKYLVAWIDYVKDFLKKHIEEKKQRTPNVLSPDLFCNDEDGHANDRPTTALKYICDIFGLSDFEKLILVFCAATELDHEVSQLCAEANGSTSAAYPTFSLALAALPGAHWSAIAPSSPLRRFRLIEVSGLPQTPLTKARLQIEERVLHFLTGVSYLDVSLQGVIKPVRAEGLISDSQKQVVSSILHAWNAGHDKDNRNSFQCHLVGSDEQSKKLVASSVCEQLGMMLWQLPSELLSSRPDELETIAQIWIRESALMNACLYIIAQEDADPAIHKTVTRFMTSIGCPVFLSTGEPWAESAPSIDFEVSKPTRQEQLLLWRLLIEKSGDISSTDECAVLNDAIFAVVNQFNLNSASIQSAVSEAATAAVEKKIKLSDALWLAARGQAQPRLTELVLRITPRATMDDLILPEKEKHLIRSIIASVRQRYRVYEEWGFGATTQRGLGITALFAGDSGTGKSMAAEVIANELRLDLFRIDLSVVVSKYIGETEKNLRRIFDAAEDGGAILLFDEADALFGKRSEVRDSHDRYANIEVGYLLQRMEAYSGLAILTTNMKGALDEAFMRRLRFVVSFPFPNEKNRKEIWKRVFPKSVPLSNIDFDRLAQLDVAGGHIRNIALAASIIAADQGVPVGMAQLASAAKEEYGKMERPSLNIGLEVENK